MRRRREYSATGSLPVRRDVIENLCRDLIGHPAHFWMGVVQDGTDEILHLWCPGVG